MSTHHEISEDHLKRWFKHYLEELDELLPRENWPAEDIKDKFAKRSANQIREEQTVYFANPCFDLSLILYDDLRKQPWATPAILVERHINHDRYANGKPGMHFAVPFLAMTGKDGTHPIMTSYFAEFRTENQVHLGKGHYRTTRKHIKPLETFTIPLELEPDKNIFENLAGIIKDDFLDLESYLERLIRTSKRPGEFEEYQARIATNPSFYLTTDF